MRGLVRLRRLQYRGRTSFPMLSGDAFASVADVVVDKPLSQMSSACLRSVRDAGVIFCKSEFLRDMLAEGSRLSARTILAGNSDVEFHDHPERLPPRLRLLLLQNSYVSDNCRIYTLPIGLENLALGQNGLPKLFRHTSVADQSAKVLIGPFGATHSARAELCEQFRSTPGPWEVREERMSPGKLAKVMSDCSHVLCPRGNGVDTHRHWEALYRGAVPVVEESSWSLSLRVYGFPQMICASLTPQSLLVALAGRDLSRPRVRPTLLPWLWIPTWTKWVAGGGRPP